MLDRVELHLGAMAFNVISTISLSAYTGAYPFPPCLRIIMDPDEKSHVQQVRIRPYLQ
jgi:hypothetical protein